MQQNLDGKPRFNTDMIPKEDYIQHGKAKCRAYLKPGLKIPPPHGKLWRGLMDKHNLKRSKWNRSRVIQANQAIREAANNTYQGLKAVEALIEHWDANRAKKRRVKAADTTAAKQPPTSIPKALRDENRTEAYKWLDSINSEWQGLNELGVVEHGFTWQQLREYGIHTNPIPFSVCLTYKFNKEGEVDRYKTRMALAGHGGNMQRGIHYDKTYSSTPRQHTCKGLQAMMVRLKLLRLAFDIKMAYCRAKLPDEHKIAVRYPEGFRRYHPDTQEELFMILRGNLYGHPGAGRYWEKERNQVLECVPVPITVS